METIFGGHTKEWSSNIINKTSNACILKYKYFLFTLT